MDGQFTQEMRKTTKEIHRTSDLLVNAKLGTLIFSNEAWADGLCLFYPIFEFLETAMSRHQDLGKYLVIPELLRCKEFQEDIRFLKGDVFPIRSCYEKDAVVTYLEHLKLLEEENPSLLLAYVYHMYMGLFSGGQILRKKYLLKSRLGLSNSSCGSRVTTYEKDIALKKRMMKEITNDICGKMTEGQRKRVLEEGITLFELNNALVKTIRTPSNVYIFGITLCMLLAAILIHYFTQKTW